MIDDPYLIAYDVAKFEHTLSDVSHSVENNHLFMLCFLSYIFMTNTKLHNVSALYNLMLLGNFTDLIPQVRS